ncbi:HlyD family efflux transporter periplasmic adaptor subunit [Spirulina sp. 06S082]|uniref:HlyD family efflux transporter periplasmic adaptor subunit n=1 Tax=Spirulina sp. 06S082 TaxID=3110248 RepID=UPI002B1F4B5C|nr:HlyD family efflux transporter periplasmic adaptor subunit [Spirulina sp. 06S082]MEA5468983.1 HlyD family efflux transporter periplasmic adaptor subunit [Spirulina sp. 06S082]
MRLVLGSGAIAVAGIGGYLGYWFFFNPNTKAISVQAIAIERGEVVKSVPAGGVVQLGNQQSLKVPTSADRAAIVEAIAVSVNSPITEGQILVRLRDPEGQTQVNEQRLQIQKQQLALEEKERAILQAQAALDLAKNDLQIQQQNNSAIRKAESDRDRAQEKIKEQQIELEALQVELESTRDLVKQGYLAANEQRTQEQIFRTTEATLRDYEKNLQQAELDLKNQRLMEQQTLKQLQEKIRIQEIALEDARSAVQTSRRDLEREQINLIKSEQNFEKNSLIRATTTGRVLDINVKEGEVLKQDSILLTIGDPRREEVEIRLTTLQAALVKINQPAIVSAIGLISGSFPGQVKELGKVALEDANTSQSRGGTQSAVKAVVVLNRPSKQLIPGSQVSVEIIIDRQANAIALPPQFIQDSDSKNPYVWVLSDSGTAERREIKLGLVGDTSTEIKTGLEPGEQVVSPPPDGSIEEGMKLMPIIDEQQITNNDNE